MGERGVCCDELLGHLFSSDDPNSEGSRGTDRLDSCTVNLPNHARQFLLSFSCRRRLVFHCKCRHVCFDWLDRGNLKAKTASRQTIQNNQHLPSSGRTPLALNLYITHCAGKTSATAHLAHFSLEPYRLIGSRPIHLRFRGETA